MIKLPKRKGPTAEQVIVFSAIFLLAIWMLVQILKGW